MAYNKICPICSKSFFCKKITTIFCSKKCNNRARSLPDTLRLELIRRSNLYVMKANNYIAEVPDIQGNISKVGYEPKDATISHPLGKDEGYLIALAKMKKEQIDKDNQERKKSLESSSGFDVIGDNKENDIEECPDLSDILDKEPKKQKSLESQSGFNITDEMIQVQEEINTIENNHLDNIELQSLKKYKIKSLQRNGDK